MAEMSTHDDLVTEIQLWLEREGDTDLINRIPTIIQMAESWLNRELNGYQREVTGTITTDASGYADLPTGFISLVAMSYGGQPYRTYSLGGGQIYVADGSSRTLDVIYRSRLPGLSDSNPTNWLLEIAPDAYLYACLSQASVFLENVQGAALYASQASNILSSLNLQSIAAQFGGAGLRSRGVTP